MLTLRANISEETFATSILELRAAGHAVIQELPTLRMAILCARPARHANTSLLQATLPGDVEVERDASARVADDVSWALDRIDQPALPLDRYHFDPRNCSKHLGGMVDVFVVDTGCQVRHGAFGDARIRTIGAPGTRYKDGEDRNGHGTAVASVVVGTETGVARRANVTCVKAMGDDGRGKFSSVIAALEVAAGRAEMVAGRRGVFAVLSLTGRAGSRFRTMDVAVGRAMRKGVVTFSAAGNEGKDGCGFTPGRSVDGISVGATDRWDSMAGFSNFGKCVDAVAPGTGVLVAKLRGGVRRRDGTSFAAPLVAGVVALVWEGGGGGEREIGKAREVVRKLGGGRGRYPLPSLDGRCHGGRVRRVVEWERAVGGGVGGVLVGVIVVGGVMLGVWMLKRRNV